MDHGGDVIAELTTDHRWVNELFEQFSDAPSGSEDRKRLADALTIELVQHSVAEELHLYPAVRARLENGDALADKEIADHARVEQLLKDLEQREADDADFDRLMAKLRTEVTAHVDDEEHHLFPRLRNEVHPNVLQLLGDKIREAKATAPTRPHPSVPSTPPVNKLLTPGLGLVDRVRDYFTSRNR